MSHTSKLPPAGSDRKVSNANSNRSSISSNNSDSSNKSNNSTNRSNNTSVDHNNGGGDTPAPAPSRWGRFITMLSGPKNDTNTQDSNRESNQDSSGETSQRPSLLEGLRSRRNMRIPILSQIVYQGLVKKAPFHPTKYNIFASSRLRYFILERDGTISYYKDEVSFNSNPINKLGEVHLDMDSIVTQQEDRRSFTIELNCVDCGTRHTYCLETDDENLTLVWIMKMNSVIRMLNNKVLRGVDINKHLVEQLKSESVDRFSVVRRSIAPQSFASAGRQTAWVSSSSNLRSFDHRMSTIGFHPTAIDRESIANIGIGTNLRIDPSMAILSSSDLSKDLPKDTIWRGKPMDELTHKFCDILVDRNGRVSESFMRTESVVLEISKNTCYKLWDQSDPNEHPRLVELPYGTEPNIIPREVQIRSKATLPRFIEVNYIWNTEERMGGQDDNNIFGENSVIEVDCDELFIPLNEATQDNLAYFTSVLLDSEDIFEFQVPEKSSTLPLTVMSVGAKYAQDFILEGAGAYLEWHDVPHFHMPLNEHAKGHLVLGVLTQENTIKLAAFKIPFGKAVYMNPYTLHNDCFLIGDFGCVYAATDNFATGIVVNNKGENSNFTFV